MADIRLVTLDVFDTCIVRDVVDPASVAILTAAALTAKGVAVPERPIDFATARLAAEDAVRARSSAEDVALRDVLAETGRRFGWSDADVDAAVSAEVDAERRLVRRHPHADRLLGYVGGRQLAYVSDTVQSAATVRTLLDDAGLPPGRVFSSGDRGLRKASGRLFGEVCTAYGAEPAEVEHVGDDALVDGFGARLAGVGFRWWPAARPTRYERELDGPTARAGGMFGALLAGASRRTRLEAGTDLERVAVSVAGPVLLAATAWTLLQAERDGVRRLYFAARDGELPLQIALLLKEKLGLAPRVECSYLYGSRVSWSRTDDPALLAYLHREGVTAPGAAVVDVGWTGRAVGGLLRALERGQAAQPAVYLLGGLCGPDSAGALPGARCFLIDERGRSGAEQQALVHLIESFCQGSEGTTTGFTEGPDGVATPVLAAARNDAALAWGLPEFQAAVLNYVLVASSVLSADDVQLPAVEAVAPALVRMLAMLWDTPSTAEAAALAGCPFDNPAGSPVTTLARPLRAAALGRALRRPATARAELAIGPWRAAARALSGAPAVHRPAGLPAMSWHGLQLRLRGRSGRRYDRGAPDADSGIGR